MTHHLRGKVAIVTGGSRGIGRAEALFLAKEGAAVVVNGRTQGEEGQSNLADEVVEEIRMEGGTAISCIGNVADWKFAETLIETALSRFGRLDILLCNAGIARDRMLQNMSETEWDSVIDAHLKGHFAPTHFAANHWRSEYKKTNSSVNGRVIFTVSTAGLYGGIGQSNYAAAKAGIVALCYSAAKELARFGVTVNTISPRARTRMTETAFGTIDKVAGSFDKWDPANMGPFVGFLASDAAANITGQVFVCYGGTVQRIKPATVEAEIAIDRAWTLDELMVRAKDLMPDLQAQPPAMPDIGLT